MDEPSICHITSFKNILPFIQPVYRQQHNRGKTSNMEYLPYLDPNETELKQYLAQVDALIAEQMVSAPSHDQNDNNEVLPRITMLETTLSEREETMANIAYLRHQALVLRNLLPTTMATQWAANTEYMEQVRKRLAAHLDAENKKLDDLYQYRAQVQSAHGERMEEWRQEWRAQLERNIDGI